MAVNTPTPPVAPQLPPDIIWLWSNKNIHNWLVACASGIVAAGVTALNSISASQTPDYHTIIVGLAVTAGTRVLQATASALAPATASAKKK